MRLIQMQGSAGLSRATYPSRSLSDVSEASIQQLYTMREAVQILVLDL